MTRNQHRARKILVQQSQTRFKATRLVNMILLPEQHAARSLYVKTHSREQRSNVRSWAGPQTLWGHTGATYTDKQRGQREARRWSDRRGEGEKGMGALVRTYRDVTRPTILHITTTSSISPQPDLPSTPTTRAPPNGYRNGCKSAIALTKNDDSAATPNKDSIEKVTSCCWCPPLSPTGRSMVENAIGYKQDRS